MFFFALLRHRYAYGALMEIGLRLPGGEIYLVFGNCSASRGVLQGQLYVAALHGRERFGWPLASSLPAAAAGRLSPLAACATFARSSATSC